ncbi:MAG: hypothetical protein MJ229_00860 [bacterium]|nr:hypothetical protein [bacterium]
MKNFRLAKENIAKGNIEKAVELCLAAEGKDFPIRKAVILLAEMYLKDMFSDQLLKKTIQNNKQKMFIVAQYIIELKKRKVIDLYKKILEIFPEDSATLTNFSSCCILFGEIEKAFEYSNLAIKKEPRFESYCNLSICYEAFGDTQKALEYAQKAYKINNETISFTYINSLLKQKKFKEGYDLYFKFYIQNYPNRISQIWLNQKQEMDKTVKVLVDKGYGDAFMFCRYIPFLAKYFKKIKIEAKDYTYEIFKNNYSDIKNCQVEITKSERNKYGFYTTEEDTDFSIPILFLPYCLNMDFKKIPDAKGYLKANEEKVNYFKNKYFNTNKLKVGICWNGRKNLEKNSTAKFRNCDLEELEKLFDNDKIQFYSFQKDYKQRTEKYPQIIDFTEEFENFDDTLAALKNLDLLISVDTSVANLAGASGVKTFLMLPKLHDWRWFEDKKTTPWYQSVKIFKQTKFNDWTDVIENINKELKKINI